MQLKKISAIFLAAALMLFSLATVAGAEDTKIFEVEVEALTTTSTLSSSPIIYSPGEEFTVKISAGQNTGITSVKFKIDYDETALEVVSDKCKATNLFTASDELTHKVSSTGDGYFLFDSDNYPQISTATGTFVELTFVAKEVCVKNSAVAVSLFKNSDGFCMVQTASGLEVVPFASNGDTFSIHDLDTENKIITPAKCLEDGYTTYSCKACNESVVGNVVPATGHSQAEPVVENTVAPTCTKEGSYDSVVYCSVCHTELSRENKVIPVLAHTPAEAVEENKVEPTCTKEGSYDSVVYCSVCHTELSRENVVVNAIGHKFGETTVVEPQYQVDGYSIHTCEVCGFEEKFDIVPALPYPIYPSLTYEDDVWYYTVNGAKSNDTTLVYYNDAWFYVENGTINWSANTLCYYNDNWFYVENGMINWNARTLCYYNDAWFFVENGTVNWNAYTTCEYYGNTYNVVGGVVVF